MECAHCGFENREGKRFCVECGAALARRCPGCATEVEPSEKFCGECGTALAGTPATPVPAPVSAAVRKTVTVLFADLSGSTGFGERNDAEISRQVLARYHALLQETIDAHAGTVAKFMGDGMMATWGIPEVAEDDARRAVAAGVALQERFEEFAADVERRHGEALALRVGINTGEIVIGEGDADLIGDALNVAARLEHAARPGHVLVGEETWRLTRGDVAYEALGEVTVAGRAQPVAIFEVAVEADAEPEVAAPFVGRDAEMQRLVGVFDDARQSATARLTTVLGSPGVGKTRLSRELCARLAAHGDAASVELRCDRAGEATFAPVAQLIRDSSGISDDLDADAARTAIGTLLPETETDHGRVVDVLAGLVGVGPARSVEETFWGVRRLVEATAATRPLVVVIDDIQWAEPLLLDLIEHLAEWVADAAVLLVGLARPELREVRPSLAEPGRPVAAVVVLDGLDASATEALAAGLLGTERLPVGLVERLPASTDGNPLFVRELVRMLVDDQVIRRRDDGAWELTIDAEAVDVPPTIQSLLGARVERLPAIEREVLEYASVVGAEFSLGALRELAGERAPVASLLESMRRKELVEPTGTYWGDEPVHRFHHVLIRDAAYRRLLKTTRAELHERVAVWTDRTAADLVGEHEAATAFHYEQAYRYRTELGTVDDETVALGRRAAELLTTAAQRALGRDDLASAGALSARALRLLPASDAVARADLLQTGCECLLASGDGAAAKPLVEELEASAGDEPRLAAWAECYAAQLVGLTDPEGLVAADARAQAAADALTELGDGSGQAKAHQVRAGLLARLGRVGDAELELDLALAAARAADDRRRVTAVLGAAPDAALFGPSPVARAGGRCLDVVRLLRITTASPAVEAASNRCQAVLESLRGRFDVSRSMLASARAALEELGLRHGIAQTELYAGMVEMIAGDPHAAIPPLRAAYEGLGTLGVGADAGQAAALLALALLAEGAVDEAELMAAESEALAGQNLKTAIGWRVARAEVLAARGDLAAGVALAEDAVEIATGTDLVIDHADACVALAALRARAGDAAGARAARADAQRLYEQKGATVPAERLDHAEVVATPEPVPAVPVATAESDVSAPSNAAAEQLRRAAELFAARRFDECGALCAEDFRLVDRRQVVGADLIGRAAFVANMEATAELGSGSARFEPIAVRGSTLALGRNVMDFGDWGSSFLALGELGPDGLGVRNAWFDEADLDAAIDELDAWYVAGEGAEHAGLSAANAAWFRAMNAHDGDAMRELSAPGLVFVDHRQLGVPPLDVDAFVDWLEGYGDVAFELVVVDFQARGPVDLVTAVNRAVDADGGEILWTFFAVGVFGPDWRATRIEQFDVEDRDAALARFEELSASGERSEPSVVGNLATSVHARVIAAIAAGDDQTLADLIAPEFEHDDRRSVVNMGVADRREAARSLQELRAQGFEWRPPIPVAVRGERLGINRSVFVTDAGDDNSSLAVFEIDAQDRLLSITQFDHDALDAAIEELDARYVAGEGAEHADLVATNAAFFRALNHFDLDAMRGLAGPGFVYVDHRSLGTPPLDIEAFIGWQEGYRGVENHALVVDIQVRGRVDLVTAVNRAVDVHGGEIHWPFLVVGVVGADGRAVRTEVFAPEDRDAALARFEELSRRSTAPPIENAATRAFDGVVTLATDRRFDEFATVVAADFERIDRRTGVSAEPVRGAEAWATAFRSTIESGMDRLAVEHLAVRGDRLALDRLMFTSDAGDESPMLGVIEVDGSGLLSFISWHDEDALDAAAEELDARYVAGEGAEHAELVAAGAAWFRAMREQDFDALGRLVAPGAVFVDHRTLGAPALDLDGFLEWQRSYADVEMRMLVTNLRIEGRVGLVTVRHDGVDRHGGSVEWGYHGIGVFDGESRYLRSEMFSDDDWDAALARFEELRRGSGDRPPLENTATRTADRLLALLGAGQVDEVEELLAPGMVSDDRRSAVSWGRVGRDELLEGLRASGEVGLSLERNEVVAVRGDRLTLGHVVWRTAAGDEISQLTAGEVDADGRCTALVTFDDDRFDDAISELDARYAAGEGVEHTDVLRAAARVVRAFDEDPDALVDLCAPDFTLDDHRRLMYGTGDRSHLVSIRRASPDDHVRRTVTVNRRLIAQGRAVLALQDLEREDPDGAVYRWTYCTLASFNGSWRLRSLEWFDEDDWDAALARLDELDAESPDPRTPNAENAQTRAADRYTHLVNGRRWDEATECLATDFTRVDHRSGVAAEPADRDAYMTALRGLFDVGFTAIALEHLAVRGEGLALTAATFTTDAGSELEFLIVADLDGPGRISFMSLHDPDDLDAALAELDERYLEGEGAEHADLLRRALAVDRAFRADPDAAAAMFAPGFVFDDRRRLQYGEGDLAHLTAARRASDATGLDVVATVNRKAFVAGRTILTVQRALRRAPDGRDFEWTAYLIIAFDPDLRLGRLEYYDEDDWDAALARFDELSASDPRTPGAENAASRTSQRVLDLTAAGHYDEATALFRPDFERFDRRRTAAGPTITSRAEYMASFRLILDQFDAITIEPVAVRGDRLHLSRTRFSTESGFETEFWHIAELDDAGLICWIASHDEDELDAALAEMDARYLAGEGAEHADVLRSAAQLGRCHAARDWTGLRELFRADAQLVDHRRFGWPTGDRDVVVQMFRELVEMVPDHRLVYRNQHVAGRAVLTTVDSIGTARDGAYEWVLHSLSVFDPSGRISAFELFDENDWDAALARLDELAAAAPFDHRTLEIDNAAMRLVRRGIRLVEEGRFEELEAIYHPDLRPEGRRRVVAVPAGTSREAWAEYMRIWLEQYSSFVIEPVAVRGDRIAAYRTRSTNDAGDETVLLTACEIDASDRVIRQVMFDERDEIAAIDLLDEWYVEGQGAERAQLVQSYREHSAAIVAGDRRALAALLAPEFEYVDHRPASWGTLRAAGYVEMWDAYDDVALTLVMQKAYFDGRVMLTSAAARGATADGTDFEWEIGVVFVAGPDGRARRIEFFAEDDWNAALARLDELGAAADAAPSGPELENAATRNGARFEALVNADRFDELGALIAPGIVSTDGRSLSFDTTGREELLASLRATRELGLALEREAFAVRGDRLAVGRASWRSEAGDEIRYLTVSEVDGDGRFTALVAFEDDLLLDAIAELDARYLAGEGAEHAAVLRPSMDHVAAINRRDWAALAATMRPDIVVRDHRGLWPATSDRAAYLARIRSLAETSPDSVVVSRRFDVAGNASLATYGVQGTSEHGERYEYGFHVPALVADGVFVTFEFFAEEDLAAALARFDELAASDAAPTHVALENTATRTSERLVAFVNEERFDELEALIAPDIVNRDRRSTVSFDTIGRDELVAGLRASRELRLAVEQEVIAVRGDRLGLSTTAWRTAGGDEVVHFSVGEVDARGRLTAMVQIDADRLDDAIALLDEWYLEGLGAEEAFTIRRAGDFVRSMAALDGAATLALVHPDVRWTDHRRLGFGAAGFDGVRDFVAARAEDSDNVEDRPYFRDLTVRRPTMMGRIWSAGIRADGEVAALYEFHWVARFVAGKMHDIDWYDLEDVDAARARFEELAAAPPPAGLDNACVRALERAEWSSTFGSVADAIDAVAPGIVSIDWRSGTGGGFRIEGRDAYVENQAHLRTSIDGAPRFEWLAVRGERQALAEWTWTSGNGFEIAHLALLQVDDEGRVCRSDQYDVEDLTTALAALDAWYVEGEGAEHAERLRSVTRGWATIASGDEQLLDRWLDLVAPGFAFVDHRHAGWGSLDVNGLVEMQRSFVDVQQSILLRRIRFGERATLSTVLNTGVDPDGGEAEWRFHAVSAWDTADRVSRLELFDDERWEAALDRFDELDAAPQSDPRTLEIENSATRSARLSWRLLPERRFDELPAVAPGFSLESRRRFLRLPGEQDWLNALMLLIEQYSSFSIEPLAIRGARAAVVRVVASDGSGNESAWIATLQLDDSDRWLRQVNFDEEDETAAIDLLDEWYIEGEGAADAEVLTAQREGMRRYHAHDWDWLRANGTPDFEFVDHRPLPWPTSDAEGLIRLMQERVEQVPDVQSRIRKLFVSGRAILSVGDVVGTDEHGGLQQWPVITVYEVDTAGTNRRIEYFAPEQWEAALARFDELTAASVHDTRTPEIVNASTRALDAMWAAAIDNRFEDLAAVLAPAAVRDDRRKGVAAAPMNGDGEYLELLRSSFADGQVRRVDSTPLAVRGDRLSLSTVVSDVLDFEIAFLILVELDDEGRIAAVALFDEEDLAAAQDELDDRFVVGEAAPHAALMTTARAYVEATNARDLATVAALNAPGVTLHDHRLLGALDATNYLPFAAEEVVTGGSMLVTKYLLGSRALLAPAIMRGVDANGGEALWFLIAVDAFDADARYRRVDFYDAEDWDAALARFDEIVAESPAEARNPRAENAVTRMLARERWREDHDQNYDRAAGVAPDVTFEDRRSGVSLPELRGVDQLRGNMAAQDESFGPTDFEPIAVRGEHLALVSTRSTSESGFELTSLMVFETDDADRVRSMVSFDPDALAAAVDELDDRFLAGEGAPDARVLSVVRAAFHAIRDEDTDALGRLLSPALVTVDHQRIGLGTTTDRDAFLERGRSDQAVMRRDREYPRKGFVSGGAVLVVYESERLDPYGGEVLYQSYFVARVDASDRIDRMEWFDLDDWDAAVARFDELAAESTPDPRHPRAENAATRLNDRYHALLAAGRFDEGNALVAPEFALEDHRRAVSLPDVTSGDMPKVVEASRDVGFTSFEIAPLAVRGDQLTLGRGVMATADGFEVRLLVIDQLGADGRAIGTVYFEEDDLAAALDELDARYLASGGATDAEAQVLAGTAALNRRDYDALTALLAPDFVSIDHSPLGFPPADRRHFVHEQMAGLDAMVPDNVRIPVKVLSAADMVLAVTRVIGTTTEGSTYEWVPIFVAHSGADGLVDRMEFYAPEDWDAALARFDELEAEAPPDPRHPRAENAMTRINDRYFALAEAGRTDEGHALVAPEYVREDRRTVVALPDASGDEIHGAIDAARDVGFTSFRVTPIAVRGDRLTLGRGVMTTADGFEVRLLVVDELGADGRAIASVYFDEDALAAAIEELDARYVASGEATDVELEALADTAMLNRRDYAAFKARLSPQFVLIDHSPLGFPPADRDAFTDENLAGLDAIVPDNVKIVVKLIAARDGVLMVNRVVGTTTEGNEYEWAPIFVCHLGPDGLIDRTDAYAPEDWDAALARFDELAASTSGEPAAASPLENAAVRCFDEMVALANARDDDGLRAWTTPEFTVEDRRSVVAGPTTAGEEFVTSFLDGLETFDSVVTDEVVAIRGDRLVLTRTRWVDRDGFDVPLLAVSECGGDGRPLGIVTFDDDDLTGAMQELEDRYVASEGAADTYVVRRLGDYRRAYGRRDWDAITDLCAPDLVAADHRLLPYPLADRDSLVAMQQGAVELVPDVSLEVRTVEVGGDALLSRNLARGTSADGSQVMWEYWNTGRWVAGRIANCELFDLGDEASARARFDELAAIDARTPVLDNEGVRLGTRHAWLLRHDLADALDQALDLMAPDLVQIDSRKGVSQPDIVGRDKRLEVLGSFVDVFRTADITVGYLAVRGDRLALNRWRVRAGDGSDFELTGLDVTELDDDGRQYRIVTFDEDDLVSAVEELERRHEELSGDAYSAVERTYVGAALAVSRGDIEGWRALLSPEITVVDHRPIVGGEVHGDTSDHLTVWRDLTPDLHSYRMRSFVAGDAMLSALAMRGTTPEGSRYEWDVASVARVDSAGLLAEEHFFPVEQWEEARAVFDEWSTAEEPTPVASTPLRNSAMYYLEAAREFSSTPGRDVDEFAVRWLADDVVRVDRRTGVSAPEVSGRDAYADVFRAMREAFVAFTLDPLAVRGDRLALVATVGTSPDGFELPYLILVEVDEAGRATFLAHFDDRDLAGAFQELEDRYVAGEGATDAYAIRRLGDLVRARTRRDWDAFRDVVDPELQLTDHRMLPLPTAGRDGFLAQQRSLVEVVPDVTAEFRTLEVLGDTAMSSFVQRGASADGAFVSWELWAVWRLAAGRIAVFDFYDITDEASARARFEELAALDPRTPTVDNECVRVQERHAWLLARSGDDVSLVAGYDLLAPDVVQIDRRHGVAAPDLVGRDVRVQNLAAVAATFGDLAVDELAVRGEGLALFRWTITADGGFHVTGYDVNELDADGRIARIVTFDDSQLRDAVEELERRHEDLSGDGYAPVERAFADAVRAANRGDFDAVAAAHAAGYEQVDHAPLGIGGTDSSGLVEHHRALHDQVDLVLCPARIFVAGRIGLAYLPYRGTTADGGEYVWALAVVKVLDEAGLVVEDHTFLVEQWDEARALFDELSAARAVRAPAHEAPAVRENRATRHMRRFQDLLRDDPGAIAAMVRPGFAYADRRWGGVAPPTNGPDGFLRHIGSAGAAGFTRASSEVLAVRGASLALARWTVASDSGDTVAHLSVSEIDADDLAVRTEIFEAGDLALAVHLLDEWYLEGEGAEHAWMIGPSLQFWRSYNARDWDGFRRVWADEVCHVDHRLASAGTTLQTADEFVAYAQGLIDLVPDVVAFEAEYLAIGRVWALTRQMAYGTSVDGAEIERPSLILAAVRNGRFTDSEMFEPEQRDEARARFEELEAAERSNRATAAGERARAAALRGDRAETLDAFSPDFRRIEGRPRAISGERVVGRDLYVDGMLAGPDAGLTHFDAEILETAGDDHALTHVRWHNDAGSVQEWLFVGEVDGTGRLRRIANFDPDDRMAASALLHTWASPGPQSGDRMSVTGALRNAALDRGDRAGVLATYAPDFVREDHRRGVNFGTSDREETVDALLAGNDVGLGDRTFTTIEVVDDEHTLVEFRMSHTDGFEVVYLLALESDEEGRLRRAANFDLDDRERASALLHEWAHGPAPTPAEPQGLTNAAVRQTEELAEAFAAFDWAGYQALWADEPVSEDRRTGVNSGVTRGRAQMVEFGRSLADVGFTSVAHEPVAIRGDRLALLRRTWRRPDRFELAVLVVVELDADGRYAANVMLDPDDLASALDELDRRYLAADGAEHERFVRSVAEFWRCYNARDRSGLRAYLAADYRLVDHRPASAGTSISSADEFLDYMQGLVDLAPDMFAFETEYLAFGERWCLYRESVAGASVAGAEVRLEFLSAAELVDGVFTASEVYLPEQLAEARARFEELEAGVEEST